VINLSRITTKHSQRIAAMFRCPYPGCDHAGTLITKLHCKTKHNISKDELIEKYGDPIPLLYNYRIMNAAEKSNKKHFV